jgi:peptidoglycan hydrolase CwlO-like protein
MNKKMLAAAALSGLMMGALTSTAMADDATATDPVKAEKNKCKGHEKDKCKGLEKANGKDKCKGAAKADAKNKCKGADKEKKVGDACSGKDGCNGK